MHRMPIDRRIDLGGADLQIHLARGRRLRAEAFDAAPGTAARLAGYAVRAARSGVRALAGRYRAWRQRRLAVAELQALDDRILRDIGLSRDDVARLVRLLRQGVPVEQVAVRAEVIRLPQTRTETARPGKLAA